VDLSSHNANPPGVFDGEAVRLDVTACQVMSFRDGRIADIRGHYSDQYQLDEFWS
jgi:ketosteroid isomerase-like protein